ncbi:unnamed protein product [Allacma fusca]|uniref:Aquaporin n=1 Tax=Allacma fusca TaxID=39272 RepID=A0A8J2NHV6_9HEXA|nr:unnamed protein product [Allacma fusca]
MNNLSVLRKSQGAKLQNLFEVSALQSLHVENSRETPKMKKISSWGLFSLPSKHIWRCLVAEFLGTFLLIFLCCGTDLYTKESESPIVIVAFSWGLAEATLIQTLSHVSGCHINPAVTLAMLVTGKIEVIKSMLYIIIQCIASIVAITVLNTFKPEHSKGSYGAVSLAANLTKLQGVGIEFVSTFVLVLSMFSLSDENRNDVKGSRPLAIGLCITMLIFVGADTTGTCLNPARALGPAVFMGVYDDLWVYWVAPIGGALAAAIVYERVFRNFRPGEMEDVESKHY